MATNSPGGSITDHTGQGSVPTCLAVLSLPLRGDQPGARLGKSNSVVANGGWVTSGPHHTSYPPHDRSCQLKEMFP